MVIFRSLQPEAAPTESFTEPEAIMLENINEFNNQLSHWRQRLTIPNTDQIQVIRDRLDQTVSMVCYVFVQNIGATLCFCTKYRCHIRRQQYLILEF